MKYDGIERVRCPRCTMTFRVSDDTNHDVTRCAERGCEVRFFDSFPWHKPGMVAVNVPRDIAEDMAPC